MRKPGRVPRDAHPRAARASAERMCPKPEARSWLPSCLLCPWGPGHSQSVLDLDGPPHPIFYRAGGPGRKSSRSTNEAAVRRHPAPPPPPELRAQRQQASARERPSFLSRTIFHPRHPGSASTLRKKSRHRSRAEAQGLRPPPHSVSKSGGKGTDRQLRFPLTHCSPEPSPPRRLISVNVHIGGAAKRSRFFRTGLTRADSSKGTSRHLPATSQEGTRDHLSLEGSSRLWDCEHVS